MKFLDKNIQNSKISQKLQTFLIKRIPTEPIHQNKALKAINMTLYILDYLTIISIIILLLDHPDFSLTSFYYNIITYIRISLAVLHIILQSKIVLALRKIAGIIHLFSLLSCQGQQCSKSVLILLACFFVEIISCAVRTLSHELRIIHFDSKFTLKFGFIKDILISLVVFGVLLINIYVPSYSFDSTFILISAYCVIALFCDYSEKYYDFMFKRLLVGLDSWLILCLVSLYQFKTQIGKYSPQFLISKFSVMASVLLIMILISVKVLSIQYRYIFQSPRKSERNQQWQLCYRIELDQLIKTPNQDHILKSFYYYHLKICEQPDCFLKFHSQNKASSKFTLLEILQILSLKEIQMLSNKFEKIRFFYIMKEWESPDRIYKYFRSNDFFHKRQHFRVSESFITQQKNSDRIQSDLAINASLYEQKLALIKQILINCVKNWNNISNDKINCEKLLDYSCIYEENAEQLKNIVMKAKFLDRKLLFIASKILEELFMDPVPHLPEQKTIVRDYFSTHHEAYPAVLISAEKQNFMRIINANSGIIKATGYTKAELCSLTIDNLWVGKFRQVHTDLVQTRSKQNIFHHNRMIKVPAFITNKFGYTLYGEGIVLWLNEIDGKKWVVIMKPYRDEQALIITTLQREVVGVTQNALKYGIDKSIIGSFICEKLFNDSLEEKAKIGTIINPSHFIENRCISLKYRKGLDISLKFTQTLSLVGVPHFHAFSIVKSQRGSMYKAQNQDMSFHMTNPEDSRTLKTIRDIDWGLPQFQFNSADRTFYQVEGKTEWEIQENILNMSSVNYLEQEKREVHDWELYKSEIQTMRLFNNQIQFVSNLPVPILQTDSLPRAYKQDAYNVPLIKEQSLLERNEVFLHKINKKIVYLRVVFLASFILVLIAATTVLYLININNQKSIKNIEIEQFISRYFVNFINVGFYPINMKAFPQTNWLPILNNYLLLQNNNHVKLNELYPEIYSYQIDQEYRLSEVEKQFWIAMNDFINSMETNNQNKIQMIESVLINKVYPSIVKYLKTFSQFRKSQNISSLFNYAYASIGILVLIIIGIVCLRKIWVNISENQLEIMKIIAKLPHSEIMRKFVFANRYLDYLNINATISKIEEFEEQQEEEEQDIVYPKTLYNIPSQKKSLVLVIISFILIVSMFFALFLDFGFKIQKVSYIEQILEGRSLAEFNIYSSWINLMAFPHKLQETHHFFNQYHSIFEDTLSLIDQFFKKGISSKEFKQFYLKFGITNINSDAEGDFKLYGLDSFFAEISYDGERFLHSYIVINYETILQKSAISDQSLSLRNLRFAATLQLAFRANCEIFMDQALKQIQQSNASILRSSLQSAAIFCVFGILLWISYRIQYANVKKLENIERFLFSLSYQKLMEIPRFRFYVHQKLKDDKGVIHKN